MAQKELCELTCMVMVYDDKGNILVQEKTGHNWSGVQFPGGHVDPEESFVSCAIREVKEETGLTIRNLKLCGVKQFQNEDDSRYIIFYFKSKDFTGELKASEEGQVFWIPRTDLSKYKTAASFDKMIEVFEREDLNENIYEIDENGDWNLLSL